MSGINILVNPAPEGKMYIEIVDPISKEQLEGILRVFQNSPKKEHKDGRV